MEDNVDDHTTTTVVAVTNITVTLGRKRKTQRVTPNSRRARALLTKDVLLNRSRLRGRLVRELAGHRILGRYVFRSLSVLVLCSANSRTATTCGTGVSGLELRACFGDIFGNGESPTYSLYLTHKRTARSVSATC